MEMREEINKASTEGMYLKTVTGEKFTKEMYDSYIKDKKEGKAKGSFVYKSLIYYKTSDEQIIKYDYKSKKAFILNTDINKWIFSESISDELINNPNSYERHYYFVDNYENQTESELKNASKLTRYFKMENGVIIKIIPEQFLGYVLDTNKGVWILDSDLFNQMQNGNIVASEISFNDCYGVEELDLNKGKHL